MKIKTPIFNQHAPLLHGQAREVLLHKFPPNFQLNNLVTLH